MAGGKIGYSRPPSGSLDPTNRDGAPGHCYGDVPEDAHRRAAGLVLGIRRAIGTNLRHIEPTRMLLEVLAVPPRSEIIQTPARYRCPSRSVRGRRRLANRAGVRTRPPVQRPGGDPAQPHSVTNGVYRVIRRPRYLGLVVGSLGWSLAFRPGVGLVLTALLIPVLVARINAEERLLRGHFGDEYGSIPRLYIAADPGVY